jgi:hypothetical protein
VVVLVAESLPTDARMSNSTGNGLGLIYSSLLPVVGLQVPLFWFTTNSVVDRLVLDRSLTKKKY